jgi:hypothetical protein
MFFRDGAERSADGATPYVTWAIYASLAGTLILGILPVLATNLANSVNLANILP